jgi:hypothetical protein
MQSVITARTLPQNACYFLSLRRRRARVSELSFYDFRSVIEENPIQHIADLKF